MARFGDRTFGVEIECGHPGGSGYIATCLIKDDVVEFEENRIYYDYDEEMWYDEDTGEMFEDRPYHYGWTIGCDGSGIELRTPVMRGTNDLAKLREVMQYLLSKDVEVSRHDGMHVHFGAEDFQTWDSLDRLVTSWNNNVRIIENIVAPTRRGYRYPWRSDHKAKLRRIADAERKGLDFIRMPEQRYECDRNGYYRYRTRYFNHRLAPPVDFVRDEFGRNDLNIAAVAKGTIEFRLFEGCIEPNRAEAWIRFCDAFLNAVRDRRTPLKKFRTLAQLYRAINLDRKSRFVLGEKIVTKDWDDKEMSDFLTSHYERSVCEEQIDAIREQFRESGNYEKLNEIDRHIGW